MPLRQKRAPSPRVKLSELCLTRGEAKKKKKKNTKLTEFQVGGWQRARLYPVELLVWTPRTSHLS